MTDDDYQTVRTAARKKLDAAISEYATTLSNADDDKEIMGFVGAWIVAIYSPTTDDGRDVYLVECAPNQPWHASVGMANHAVAHYARTGDQ